MSSIQAKDRKIAELRRICAETYQVVGILAGKHDDVFEDKNVQKVLDNLSKCLLVHQDILPFVIPDK
jgi:hypothetical protein